MFLVLPLASIRSAGQTSGLKCFHNVLHESCNWLIGGIRHTFLLSLVPDFLLGDNSKLARSESNSSGPGKALYVILIGSTAQHRHSPVDRGCDKVGCHLTVYRRKQFSTFDRPIDQPIDPFPPCALEWPYRLRQ